MLIGVVLFLCLTVFVNYRGNKVPRWIGACLLTAILPVFATESLPAQSAAISNGATVYIEPMNGYENYLAAAFAKKHVPLAIVSDRNRAQYLITSTIAERPPNSPAVVINNDIGNTTNNAFQNGFNRGFRSYGSTSASMSLVDAHSSQVLFAYSVGKHANTNQIQSTAEACAKHLKEFIEKQNKIAP